MARRRAVNLDNSKENDLPVKPFKPLKQDPPPTIEQLCDLIIHALSLNHVTAYGRSYFSRRVREMPSDERLQFRQLILDALGLDHGEGYGRSYFSGRNVRKNETDESQSQGETQEATDLQNQTDAVNSLQNLCEAPNVEKEVE